MSSEHGSGAPSFGDLFEEPETPLHPPAPAPSAPVEQAPPAADPVVTPMPVSEEDEPEAPPVFRPMPAAAAPVVAADLPAAAPEAPAPEALAPEALTPEPTAPPTWEPAAGADQAAAPEVVPAAAWADTPGDAQAGTPVPEAPVVEVAPTWSAPAAGAADIAPVDPGPGTPPSPPSPAPPASTAPDEVAGWDHAAAPSAAAPVDTGRLYRSAGAEGPQTLDAIPALDPEWLASREQPPLGAAAAGAAAVAASHAPATVTPEPRVQGGAGLTWTGVFVVTAAATILIGVADALITGRLGWLTGLALAVSSIYAAFVVRRVDIWAAVIAPPLAFLAAVLTAGQLTLDSAGSLLLREGYMVFRSLATNAPWILGTTLVCLVIVLVRRRT